MADAVMRCCQGVLMYPLKADDFHRPRVWIRESLRPALAAAVAAPILKLWPLNLESSIPTSLRALRSPVINFDFDSDDPSLKMKRGPGVTGRQARYPNMAVTGHKGSPVAPRCKVVPTPNGSFLLLLSLTVMNEGDTWESTAISPGASMSGEKAARDGHVNSAKRMNPKNPRQNAAQSIHLV